MATSPPNASAAANVCSAACVHIARSRSGPAPSARALNATNKPRGMSAPKLKDMAVGWYVNKNIINKPHFATAHARLGVAAATLTLLSILLGALNFKRLGLLYYVPEQHRAVVKSFHRKCGAGAVLAGAACIATAIDHPAVAAAAGRGARTAWFALLAAGVAGMARVATRETGHRGVKESIKVEMGKRAAA